MTIAGRRAGSKIGVTLAAALLAGCSGPAPYVRTDSGSRATLPPVEDGIVVEPRSDRGNPPFYDVLGKRYHVLPTSTGYKARGVASWYGRDFHGLSTSSGEPYNMNAMTAAHTTLPLPTWVEVTNLGNGKRVTVKVNDRGPFVDNRLIDLSYAAALKLDMVKNGTARVEVRALGASPEAASTITTAAVAPPPVSAPAATPPVTTAAPPASVGGITVEPILAPVHAHAPALAAPVGAAVGLPSAQQMFLQVGAFGDRANAGRLVDRLKVNGFVNAFVVSEGDGRRTLHRVRVGPVRDSQEFDQVSARLRSLGFGQSQLVTAR